LLWCVAVAAGPDAYVTVASLQAALAEALEANARWAQTAGELREALAERDSALAEQAAVIEGQAADLDQMRAALAVLQRMVFGDSSEKSRPEPQAGGEDGDPAGDSAGGAAGGGKKNVKRGPGARSGRRSYRHLPRVEVIWDFPDGGFCCPECGEAFTAMTGSDHVTELLDWKVVVSLLAHCRRRYKRACTCPGPLTVTAPGPLKAIGKGGFSSGFIAMLLAERFAAGRSVNSLVTGLARQGAEIPASTLAGTCAQAGGLLVPLERAIAERNRESWHLHADETTWRVFCPPEGDGPRKWWLWVFIGPDTVCFVMDPSRAGEVLARHAGIGKDGQLLPDKDGGPRNLVLSSDFCKVYESAGRKADGLVNLYCSAHVRRHFVRAGDANPAQLGIWTQHWLDRFRDLYRAHDELMAAWQDSTAPAPRDKKAAAVRLEKAYQGWDAAIGEVNAARKKQAQAPGLQEPAKKALATLDREWEGIVAHRDCPMISLDNNIAERTIRGPVVTRKNAGGSHNGDTARNAAVIWTVTATVKMAGLNILTYLAAYLDECGRHGGKPPSGAALERFLPWKASPGDLRAWSLPPPTGQNPPL